MYNVAKVSAASIELYIDQLSKDYGVRRVLRNLSVSARAGDVVGIVGANGSGKSTLIKIVAGLLRPSGGQVRLITPGKTVTEAVERRKYVGYAAPDLAFYPELSAYENLEFLDQVRGAQPNRAEVLALLGRVGLVGREHDPVSAFSSGMKQRLRLAFALLGKTPVVLLDEPSLALDAQGVALVKDIIDAHRAAGGVTLLATNDARESAWADRLLYIESNRPGGEQRVVGN